MTLTIILTFIEHLPAKILLQHAAVETVQVLTDNEVLLQLSLECLHGGLEVGEAPVLGGESYSLHGLQLGSGVSEERK